MNDKEKWLQERIKDNPSLNSDELRLIKLLANGSTHDNDLSGAIDSLEMLLSLDALPALLNIMRDSHHSMQIRKQAATAIATIGNEYIETELKLACISPSIELRSLAETALSTG